MNGIVIYLLLGFAVTLLGVDTVQEQLEGVRVMVGNNLLFGILFTLVFFVVMCVWLPVIIYSFLSKTK